MQQEEKRFHLPFTVALVLILGLLFYFEFVGMPASLLQGFQPADKLIMDNLIEGLDKLSSALLG